MRDENVAARQQLLGRDKSLDVRISADFHAGGSAQGVRRTRSGLSGRPTRGRGGGWQVGFAEDGREGAAFEADGDGVAVGDDLAGGFQEPPLDGVGCGGGVAGQPGAVRPRTAGTMEAPGRNRAQGGAARTRDPAAGDSRCGSRRAPPAAAVATTGCFERCRLRWSPMGRRGAPRGSIPRSR
jgi:hypothetical protein